MIRRWWSRWRDADRIDSCLAGEPRMYTNELELPYVVLFARALAIADRAGREARVLELAAAYRTLFGGAP